MHKVNNFKNMNFCAQKYGMFNIAKKVGESTCISYIEKDYTKY